MSDERSFVTESNEQKFEDKTSQDNDDPGAIVLEEPVKDQSRESRCSLERDCARTAERVVVSCQQFCRVCRDIPDDLIDRIKRDFPSRKNCGISRLPELKRSKDDNPGSDERYAESTYSGEPIHHESRNVVEDSKGDKFIPSEVAEYRGTRSPSFVVEYQHDEVNCVTGDNDNGNQGVISFSEMDKSSKSVSDDSKRVAEASTIDKGQQEQNTCDVVEIEVPSEFHGSPELRRKFSRTSAVRDDARRLKTATLDRMGKMFKLRPTEASNKNSHAGATNSDVTENSCEKEQSRKEKANSLGRMFKLVDKNGEPRKLFPQSRTGSLSHILRRKSNGAAENNSMENMNDHGLFSRLFKQWKNRSGSGNATEEPNLCASNGEEDKSSSTKPPSTSRINLSSSSTNPPLDPALPAQRSSLATPTDVDYPA